MNDWLIVGGGIHGVHLAARLIGEADVDPRRLHIVDPAPRLLHQWRTRTAATGMKYLRSSAVHHLDLEPWSLRQHAGRRRAKTRRLFISPYDRPALALFDAHCERVIERYGLGERHVQARAERISVGSCGVEVSLSSGETSWAEQIVLATGMSEKLAIPSWVPPEDPRMHHVFAPEPLDFAPGERAAVVGGGISAAQVALRLIGEGHPTSVLCRHPIREHQLDAEPGWLGPKYMESFGRQRCMARRRAIIGEARHRGSIPGDVRAAVERACADGRLEWREGEVSSVETSAEALRLYVSHGPTLEVDRVVLATGSSPERPGGALVDRMISEFDLPRAECGYPIVDRSLRWHPRVFVTGPLAELELGPVARNIVGARRAAERIVPTARSASVKRAS